MALQTSLNGSQQRGKKPARQHKEKAEVPEDIAGAKPQWVEDAPFYLDAIESFQATLTEEEKESLHFSLQSQRSKVNDD